MANPEHLSMLLQGATGWNAWRKANKTIRLDLQNANLSGRNLSQFNLKEARMKEANLNHCDLSQAKLDNAYLRKADLTGANLTQASLAGANLRHAILHHAILTKAYLRRADLSYTDLREAIMNESALEYTKLVDADVPDYKIPFLPILQKDEQPIAMFANLGMYDWMLELMTYSTVDILRKVFKKAIIDRAWEKHQELEKRKANALGKRSADDFLTNS